MTGNSRKDLVLAYIVGVALGDGNLSNPNGRAIRLRITCDTRYPLLIAEISRKLRYLFPENQVSKIYVPHKPSYLNLTVYSNKLRDYIPWKTGHGTKEKQKIRIPNWIKEDLHLTKACLKGLLQTDGSIYRDRGYLMVNFTNNVLPLTQDVFDSLISLGFRPTITKTSKNPLGKIKYTVRVARDTSLLVNRLRLYKK